MFRKVATIAISALFALSLSACGGGGGSQPATDVEPTDQTTSTSAEPASTPEPEEYDPYVDNIDLTLDGGTIRFSHFEPANDELTDYENAYVFVFEFTNAQATPTQCQHVFWIQFFQNGTEISSSVSYSSGGGDQYDLVGSFNNDAMKGGTVTFGRIVPAVDNSPITVLVKPNDGTPMGDGNYQMMEVSLDGSGSSGADNGVSSPASYSAEDVDAVLQGTWGPDAQNTFTFDKGNVTFNAGAQVINGTYVIDIEASKVLCTFQATDGTVDVSVPFTFDGSALKLFNSEGAEITRQEAPESTTVYSVGETFTNSALGIEFLSFEIVDEIYPSDTSGYYTYCIDEEGHSYLLATCRFTNNGSDYGVPGLASAAAFSVDGNRYNASIEVDDYDRFASNYRVEAKDTDLIYVYASVPDSVLDSGDIYLFWHVPKDAKDLQIYYSGNSDNYDMVILQMPK